MLVSVVIPTYNRAHMLDRAIASALNQTSPPYEIIVVDDCSSDRTRECLADWQQREPRVRPVFLTSNQGPAGARNRGVAKAQGELIAFLDSDDTWRDGHLEAGTRFLAARPDLDLVFADIRRSDPDGTAFEESLLWQTRQIGRYLRQVPDAESQAWYTFSDPEVHVLLQEYVVPMQTIILRREAASACPFDESFRVAEDYDFTLRLARMGRRFGFIRRVACEWIIHDGNLVSNQRTGSTYAQQQAKVWLNLMKDPTVTGAERRLLRRRIAKWRFDEGYEHLKRGDRCQARRCHLQSLGASLSWRAAKGTLLALFAPRCLTHLRTEAVEK